MVDFLAETRLFQNNIKDQIPRAVIKLQGEKPLDIVISRQIQVAGAGNDLQDGIDIRSRNINRHLGPGVTATGLAERSPAGLITIAGHLGSDDRRRLVERHSCGTSRKQSGDSQSRQGSETTSNFRKRVQGRQGLGSIRRNHWSQNHRALRDRSHVGFRQGRRNRKSV